MTDEADRAWELGHRVLERADHDAMLAALCDRIPWDSIDGLYDCPICGDVVIAPSREAFFGGHLLTHLPVRARIDEPGQDTGSASVMARRKAGRPGWTQDLFDRHFQEAEAATDPPRSVERLAASFPRRDGTPGIEPDSLRRLIRKFERPEPSG